MKCPNCGAEVKAEDKFCGECGKPLRQEIEPKWKWESMIASSVLIFIFWWINLYGNSYEGYYGTEYSNWYGPLIILVLLGFPAAVFLMYKERTVKIKNGLAWILFPILTLLFGLMGNRYESVTPSFVLLCFFFLAVPAIVIDIFMVKKYLQK